MPIVSSYPDLRRKQHYSGQRCQIWWDCHRHATRGSRSNRSRRVDDHLHVYLRCCRRYRRFHIHLWKWYLYPSCNRGLPKRSTDLRRICRQSHRRCQKWWDCHRRSRYATRGSRSKRSRCIDDHLHVYSRCYHWWHCCNYHIHVW